MNTTALVGIVTLVGLRAVRINFGFGEEWIPVWALREQDFEAGLCKGWHIQNAYLKKQGLVDKIKLST